MAKKKDGWPVPDFEVEGALERRQVAQQSLYNLENYGIKDARQPEIRH